DAKNIKFITVSGKAVIIYVRVSVNADRAENSNKAAKHKTKKMAVEEEMLSIYTKLNTQKKNIPSQRGQILYPQQKMTMPLVLVIA
ncbi:MAG: hypothetical protein IIW46_02315, partial [Bacteroidaceae bacterium]|nr:hypothetical protein [Bacteroidaceae bacterium]